MSPNAQLRTAIDRHLEVNGPTSARDLAQALFPKEPFERVYHRINRALNINLTEVGASGTVAPIAREWDGTTWLYFRVTDDSPLAHEQYLAKSKSARTMLRKGYDNLLDPVVKMGMMKEGHETALRKSSKLIKAAIDNLEAVTNLHTQQVEAEKKQTENERLRAKLVAAGLDPDEG